LERYSGELPFHSTLFPQNKEFSCGHHPIFSSVLVGAQHSFNLTATLCTALRPPPTPWLSVGAIDTAEVFAPHDAVRGFNTQLKSFCWLLLFFTCLSAFGATVDVPFTCVAWKELQLFEFLIFLSAYIGFLTLLTLSEEFQLNALINTTVVLNKLSQIGGGLEAKHKCMPA